MEPLTLGMIGVAAMFLMVVSGVSVAFASAAVGLGGLVAMRGFEIGVGIAGSVPYTAGTPYTLSVLPMFLLIGYLAFHAGITTDAFEAARRWLGWLPGGLAVATVSACAGFAAVSGASTATAAVFARVAIPEMLRMGYDRRLAAGVVAAGGTLASLIPPSSIMVVYAVIVEQSVGRLLLAGFIPGIISALLYAAIIVVRVKLNPSLGPSVSGYSWGQRFAAVPQLSPIVLVIAILLGGMYTGWMTPTEAGAVGAFVMFVIAVGRRTMSARDLYDSVMDTAKLTVVIFTLIWGILVFVRFLGYTGLPGAVAEWIVGLEMPRLAILLLILFGYVLLGMFMDAIGMLLLTLPVVFPAIVALGFDPIWFGIILVKMVEIGLVTPPIGMNCFVVHSVRPDIPLSQVFKGIWPFVVADLITTGILIAFPEIVLFLPNLMMAG
jgi:tripartite ATP-independent transporter DctM subunit